MSIFEYIMVLVSIIIGLGITHILKNIALLIQLKDIKFYWIHTIWCINIFFMLFNILSLELTERTYLYNRRRTSINYSINRLEAIYIAVGVM